MKKLSALLAVVLFLGAVAPGVAGFLVQSVVADRVDFLNREHSEYVTAELRDYHRGWFTSSGVLELQFSDSYRQATSALMDSEAGLSPEILALYKNVLEGRLLVLVDINHGPVLVSDGVSLGLGSATAELDASTGELNRLREHLGVPYLLRQYSRIGLSGVVDFYGDAPAFEMEQATTQVRFSGLNYSGVADIYSAEVDLNVTAEEMVFEALSGTTRLAGFSYEGRHTEIQPAVWIGDGKLSLASITAVDPLGVELFNLQNLGLAVNVDADSSGQIINMDALYTIDTVTGAGELDVADVSFALSLGSIDIAALNALVEMNQSGQLADIPPEELRATVYQLTAASPTFEFGPLRTLWQNEQFDAGMNFSLDGSGLPDYENFSISDLGLWTSIVNGEAYINLSDAMALTLAAQYAANQIVAGLQAEGQTADPAEIEKVAREQGPVLLYNFTQQGVLLKTDDGYSSRVILQDGTIELNGTPIPLGAM